MSLLGERVLNCPLRMCHAGSGKRLVGRGEKEVVARLLVRFLKGSKSTNEGRILLTEGYRYLSLCLTVIQEPDCFHDIFHRCFSERVAKRLSITIGANYNNNSS